MCDCQKKLDIYAKEIFKSNSKVDKKLQKSLTIDSLIDSHRYQRKELGQHQTKIMLTNTQAYEQARSHIIERLRDIMKIDNIINIIINEI